MDFRIKNVLLAGGLLGALAACTPNPNETKLQYFPDMADSPAFKTQGNYIDPPEGSIAYNAILYPETPEESEKLFLNPFRGHPNEAQHAENGKHLFGIYCAVCHGDNGKGDGRISDKFPRPPDLTLAMFKDRKDGFYFHRITHGSALMPSYGHSTTVNERWDITLHVRNLQNNPMINPPPAAAPAAPPAKKEASIKADGLPTEPASATIDTPTNSGEEK